MPKPIGINQKTEKKKKEEQPSFYELATGKQDRKEKRDDLAELYRKKDKAESYSGGVKGVQDAYYADYYAGQANFGAKYGNQRDYDEGYTQYQRAMARYRQGLRDTAAEYDARAAAIDSTSLRSKVMLQGFHNDPIKQAESELELSGKQYERSSALYDQMAKDAATMGDQGLWNKAQAGNKQNISDYLTAFDNYGKAEARAMDSLKDSSPGEYYGLTLSGEKLNERLDLAKRRLADLDSQIARLEGQAHEARAGIGDRRANSLEELDRMIAAEDSLGSSEHSLESYQQMRNQMAREVAVLEYAQKFQAQRQGEEIAEKYLAGGELTDPEMRAKITRGRLRFAEDKEAARNYVPGTEKTAPESGRQFDLGGPEYTRYKPADLTVEYAANLEPGDADLFYALYADDPKQAEEWIRYISLRRDEEFQQSIAEWAKDKGWLGAAINFGAGTQARMLSGIANAVDPYGKAATQLSRVSAGLLGGSGEFLNEKIGTISEKVPIVGGKGAGDLYQLGSSIAESTAVAALAGMSGDYATAVSAIGTMLMGSSAAVSDFNESMQKGLTRDQASQHALAAGIAEAAFEYLSVENLVNWKDFSAAWKDRVRMWLTQSGVEASEEFLTTLGNRLSDGWLARSNGYDTQIETRMKELIALGLSYDEAQEKAEREWIVDLINDGIGGWISGGFSGGMQLATDYGFSKYNQLLDWSDNRAVQEARGAETRNTEAQALQSFAEANGIYFDNAAVQGVESRAQAEQAAREKAAAQAEQSTLEKQAERAASEEQKQSRKERRQERKSNRSLGAVQEQAVTKIRERLRQDGLNSAQAISEELTGKHGAGIAGVVQEAVSREARAVFAKASNQTALNTAYKQAVEGVTAKPVRQAIERAYNQATLKLAQGGDSLAKNRFLQQTNAARGKLNLNVQVKGENGAAQTVQITDVLNNAEKVKLSNGQVVDVDSLEGLDSATKDVLDRMKFMEVGNAAPILWKSFLIGADNRTDAENYRYVMDWMQAYDQGRTHWTDAAGNEQGISLQEATERSHLDADDVRRAYELGEQDRQSYDEKKKARLEEKRKNAKKGFTGEKGALDDTKVSEKDLKAANAKDSTLGEQIKMAGLIAEGLGVNVQLFNSFDKATWHGTENGSYNPVTNTIMLDINAGKKSASDFKSGLLAVCGHELTHWMETYAYEAYSKYKDAVVKYIGKEKLEELILEQQSRDPSLTRDEAIDEIVADASMDRMADKEFWQVVSDNLGEDRAEVKGKIAQYVSKFLGAIRKALGTKQTFYARDVVAQMEKDLQSALSALYAEGIREAAATYKGLTGETATETKENTAPEGGEQSDIMLSARDEAAFNDFSAKIDDVVNKSIAGKGLINGKSDIEPIAPVGPKIDAMVAASSDNAIKLKNRMLALESGYVWHEYDRHTKVNAEISRNQIAFTKRQFKNAIKAIASPDMVECLFTSANNPTQQQSFAVVKKTKRGRYVVVEAVGGKRNPVVYPVMILQFTKSKWESMMRQGKTLGEILFSDDAKKLAALDVAKNKTSRVSAAKFESLAAFATDETTPYPPRSSRLDNSINETEPEVKGKDQKSSRATDEAYLSAVNSGDMETAQRMVDEAAKEAGYTIKAYHGTTEEFTEFSRGKQGQNHKGYLEFGAGFYFTPSEKEAGEWASRGKNGPARAKDSKVMAVYLNPGRIIDADAPIPGGAEYLQTFGLSKADAVFVANRTYRFINYLLEDKGYSNLEVQETLKALGYDAIESTYRNRTEGQYVVFDPEQIKSADPVTYDDKGKPIPLSQRFDDTKRDIRFSMKAPVEQTDRLIALHNLSAEKLGKALALGGFPMPSIAVTKTSIPHTNFGPITLVMDKSTIDPMQDRRNTVYSADAWTPTFPSVEYEVNEKAASRLRKKYFEIMEKYGNDAAKPLYPWANYAEDELNRKGGPEEILDRYRKDPDMMKLYLVDNGLNVPATVTEETVERMDESTVKFYDTFVQEMGKDVFEELMVRKGETAQDVKKRWYAEHGDDFEAAYRKYMQGMGFSEEEIGNVLNNETISSLTRQAINIRNYLRTGAEKKTVTTNVTATNDAIRAAVNAERYDAWLHGLFDGIVKSQGIYNGKDRFTPIGNERSFAATHYSVTLENIAKAMAAQNDGNSRNVSGFHGVKSLRAGTAKRFSSIAEMHKYEKRLQHLTEEQAEKINEELTDRLGNVMGQIYDSKPHGKYDNSFIVMDAIGENLMEITEQKNITNASIQRVFSKYGYQISDALAGEVRALLFDISQMPVNIYEAKPERAVRFDEVLAAIVPTDTDKALLEKLRDAGVQNLIEYKAGDDTDRLAKVNSVEGAQFSTRDQTMKSDLELMAEAADTLSEAGGEEYWKALLESEPDLAENEGGVKNRMQKIRELARKLSETEKKLDAARADMKPTDRKLRTQGISNIVKDVMKNFAVTDAKNNGIVKKATQALIDGYQEALDAIDAGKQEQVMDITYNAAVKAAEILLTEGRHTENYGGKWSNVTAERWLGEDRQQLVDYMVAAVGADFAINRYRKAIKGTKADRLIARTRNEMQKKLDAQKEKGEALSAENAKLTDENTWLKTTSEAAKEQVGSLNDQLQYLKEKLSDTGKLSSQEKAKLRRQARNLNERLQKAKEEARAWKLRAEQEGKLATQYGEKQAALIRQLQAQKEREQKILEGKLKPLAMQRMLKAVREQEAKKVTERKDEVFQNYKERQQATELRGRIKNLRAELANRLAKPTDRVYVPAELAQPLIDVLDTLDVSPREGTKAAAKYASVSESLRELALAYEQLSQEKKNEIPYEFKVEYQAEISSAVSDLAKAMQGRNIRELSAEELQKVYDIVKQIRDTMRDATKMIGTKRHASIYESRESVIGNMQYIQGIKNDRSKIGRELNRAMSTVQLDALSAMRAALMMGGFKEDSEIYQLVKDIEDGYTEMNRIQMETAKRFQDLRSGKNATEYLKAVREKSDYGMRDIKGKPVMLTKMQAMQILMTWQREQANKNLVHMTEGGIFVRDADLLSKGKYDVADQTAQTVKVTPEMIASINSQMTEWDKAYMKAARETFSSLLKMSNDVLYAIKKKVHKGEEFYIPEKVDSDYLQQEVVKGGEFNLGVKEPGATKDLVQKSTLPIIIDGLDTVMNRHVHDQSQYIGMAIPIRNFAKVYNMRTTGTGVDATTVHKEITRAWGNKAGDMLMDTLRQIQNGKTYQYNTVFNKSMEALQNAFVKASLVGKISVTIKQMASYAAAGSVLSQRALDSSQQYILALLLSPNSKMAQNLYNRIDARTPEFWLRRQGLSMEEIAIDQNRRGLIRDKTSQAGAWLEGKGKAGQLARRNLNLLNPTNWIQRVDVATTGALVVACEKQAKYDGLKPGTAEYEARVTELYEKVIRETQPMYDALHRPELQKNAPTLLKMAMPFRTVPFQNYGQIMVAAGQFMTAQRDGTKAEKTAAAKHLGKTLWANFESAAIFAFLTVVANAFRHKPKKYLDEDEELTLVSFLKAYGSDVLDVSLSNLMPYGGSELKEMTERWINGDKFYDIVSVGPIELANDTWRAIVALHTAGDKYREGKISSNDLKNTWINSTMQVTKMFGLPIANLKDIYDGLKADFKDAFAGKLSIDRSNSVNASRYYKAWKAGDEAKMKTVLDELTANAGGDEEKIRTAVNSAFKTAYETDEISLEEYTRFIQTSGLFDAEKQKNKVRDLAKAAVEDGSMDEDAAIDYLTGTGLYDEDEAWKKVREWAAKAEHAEDEDYAWNQYEDLRDAFDTGTGIDEALAELREHGYTDKQLNDEISDNIRNALASGAINEGKAIQYLEKYKGMDEDKAWKTVKRWSVTAEHAEDEDFSYSQYTELYEAIDGNKDISAIVKELTAHGVDEKNVTNAAKERLVERFTEGKINETQFKNQLSRYCKIVGETADKLVRNGNVKKATGYSWDELDNAYQDGNVGASAAKQALTKYGGLSSAEADAKVRYWDFKKAYPDSTMQQETVDKYYNSDLLRSSGLTLDSYVKYYTQASKAKGTDKDGDGRTDSGSKKAAVMRIIDSLPISRSQKDALYYFNNWSANTINEAPWH